MVSGKYSNHDHYCYPETSVLKNKLGILDEKALSNIEFELVAGRSAELILHPVSNRFDLHHLRSIHRHLFQDVYDWAGELRDVDITKGNTRFASFLYIENEASKLLDMLTKENYLAGLEPEQFSERVAHYLGEINVLHPFREGNGRTQREFISQIARMQGYQIEWNEISQDEMVMASIHSYHGDNTMLEYLIRERGMKK